MRLKFLSLPKMLIKRIVQSKHRGRVTDIYEKKDYLAAYSEHTDIRVQRDPHSAVGGLWEEMGKLQFDFLLKQGLQPHHRLLDIGCGTLRGGRHLIKYLNAGNYSGIDISSKAIEYGNQLIEMESLSEKRPRLLVNKNRDLKFVEFNNEVFDFLLAQSVFTHLKPEHIEECFRHIGQIMSSASVFFFTFKKAPELKRSRLKEFSYPWSFFHSLADQHGFDLKDCSEHYKHPRNQRMVRACKGDRGR